MRRSCRVVISVVLLTTGCAAETKIDQAESEPSSAAEVAPTAAQPVASRPSNTADARPTTPPVVSAITPTTRPATTQPSTTPPTVAPEPLPVAVTVPPATLARIQPAVALGCDPSYPTLCLPPGAPDLDCGEIDARRFPVVPPDPHGFDGDDDGVGCESD